MKYEVDVATNGLLLGFIKPEDRDYGLCYKALENNPKSIQFVPLDIIDDEILEIVIRSGEQFVKAIPKEALSEYATALIDNLYPYTASDMKKLELTQTSQQVLSDFYHSVGI